MSQIEGGFCILYVLDQWFLTFFTYLTLFVEEAYQIYPNTLNGAHLLKTRN